MQDAMLSYTHPSERGEKLKTRRQRLKVVPNINRQEGFHNIQHLDRRLVCVLCAALSQSERAQGERDGITTTCKKPSRTFFKCDTCNVALCVRNFLGEKNCFYQYHNDRNIKGIDYDQVKRINKKK